MEHYTYDGKNGLWYKLVGDYYLPCLTVPENKIIGIWGECRRKHLREHQRGIYTGMLLSGKLEEHLIATDAQAEAMFNRLVDEMAEDEGITEDLKAVDQMEWVRQMNSVRSRAAEIVREELIYV